jgi:hypothetical protein
VRRRRKLRHDFKKEKHSILMADETRSRDFSIGAVTKKRDQQARENQLTLDMGIPMGETAPCRVALEDNASRGRKESPQPTDNAISRFCCGCGKPLEDFKRYFHPACLRQDKVRRTREERRHQREQFEEWLAKQTCPTCGAKCGRGVPGVEKDEEAQR